MSGRATNESSGDRLRFGTIQTHTGCFTFVQGIMTHGEISLLRDVFIAVSLLRVEYRGDAISRT